MTKYVRLHNPTEEDFQAARLNGIGRQRLSGRLYSGWDLERAVTQQVNRYSRKNDLYAVYRGDDMLVMGTAKECAEFMGWKGGAATTRYYTTPSVRSSQEKRRNAIIVEWLEDDDED